MDDISGKKFSLQDWVMKRAANQSAGFNGDSALRQDVAQEVEQAVSTQSAMDVREQSQEQRSVSNGAMRYTASPRFSIKDFEELSEDAVTAKTSDAVADESPALPKQSLAAQMEETLSAALVKESLVKEAVSDFVKDTHAAVAQVASAAQTTPHTMNPVQQLQIVKLLADLGDRLRQSEKEREILWKELDICRKQISEMEWLGEKSEKAFLSLEGHMKQNDDSVEGVLTQQKNLEQHIADQAAALQRAQDENAKLHEKVASIETAAGSAIVRVEDAVAENAKLAKRVEALGQDKARLMRKLEVVEETLVQTQDTLKAKALVLLTDQALAARTHAPQVPAWTGNDTLKTSAPDVDKAHNKSSGPLADIASSLEQGDARMRRYNVIFALLIVGALIAGYVLAQANIDRDGMAVSDVTTKVLSSQDDGASVVAANDSSQEQLMNNIAEMANKIEPSVTQDAPSPDPMAAKTSEEIVDGSIPAEFDVAQKAEDDAVARFQDERKGRADQMVLKHDKKLPSALLPLEDKALEGVPESQHDLAALYTSGEGGLKVDYVRASQWFEEAAFHGLANAQYNLAVLYHQGLGVSKDLARAMQLYRVAAAQGHPEAMYNLAIAYAEGIGTEYNAQIAAVYFQRAAAGGVVDAAYNLGLLYENGLLGESQPDEAVFWYSLAAQKGNKDSLKALDTIKKQLSMSDDVVARIVARIAEGKPEFVGADGKAALPERKFLSESTSVDVSDKAVRAVKNTLPSDVSQQIAAQLAHIGLMDGDAGQANADQLSRAISSYQKTHNLKVDGAPSEDLLVHLLAAQVHDDAPVSLVAP